MWVREIMKDQTGYHFILSLFCARPGDLQSQYVAVDMADISGMYLQVMYYSKQEKEQQHLAYSEQKRQQVV